MTLKELRTQAIISFQDMMTYPFYQKDFSGLNMRQVFNELNDSYKDRVNHGYGFNPFPKAFLSDNHQRASKFFKDYRVYLHAKKHGVESAILFKLSQSC